MTKTQANIIGALDKNGRRMASWPLAQMPAKRATLPAVARTPMHWAAYRPTRENRATGRQTRIRRGLQTIDFQIYLQYGTFLIDPRLGSSLEN